MITSEIDHDPATDQPTTRLQFSLRWLLGLMAVVAVVSAVVGPFFQRSARYRELQVIATQVSARGDFLSIDDQRFTFTPEFGGLTITPKDPDLASFPFEDVGRGMRENALVVLEHPTLSDSHLSRLSSFSKDTGFILHLTPHVTDSGLREMDRSQHRPRVIFGDASMGCSWEGLAETSPNGVFHLTLPPTEVEPAIDAFRKKGYPALNLFADGVRVYPSGELPLNPTPEKGVRLGAAGALPFAEFALRGVRLDEDEAMRLAERFPGIRSLDVTLPFLTKENASQLTKLGFVIIRVESEVSPEALRELARSTIYDLRIVMPTLHLGHVRAFKDAERFYRRITMVAPQEGVSWTDQVYLPKFRIDLDQFQHGSRSYQSVRMETTQ